MQKVLVVDDSAMDRQVAGSCLIENGLTPIYAENGRVALEVIERESPDAVLTDIQMPEMDGLQLVQKLRRLHPTLPVVLMTAHGSEEIAVQALHGGATSYVPKHNLRQGLGDALNQVREAVDALAHRECLRGFLEYSESRFVVGYENGGVRALVSHLQEGLELLNFCGDVTMLQVSTALCEALANAIEHGNLELNSAMRERGDNSYHQLRLARIQQAPYSQRRVYVTAQISREQAKYTVRDEGPGFDPSRLPDATDPENMLRPSGRGVMLIRCFMDEVQFNSTGNEITMLKRKA